MERATLSDSESDAHKSCQTCSKVSASAVSLNLDGEPVNKQMCTLVQMEQSWVDES